VLIPGKLWGVVFVIWPWNDIFVSSISIPEPSEALDSNLYQNVMCIVPWLHIGRQSFTWNVWKGLYTTVIWSKQQEKTSRTCILSVSVVECFQEVGHHGRRHGLEGETSKVTHGWHFILQIFLLHIINRSNTTL